MNNKLSFYNYRIAIIGLGYVGLPLAIEFGTKYKTIGYDVKEKRINELKKKLDLNKEISKSSFKKSKKITFTNDKKKLSNCNVYIITVPTPINKKNIPNLTYIFEASALVGKNLNDQDIVIYESTVFPGTVEEYCVPILKKKSKLNYLNNSNKNQKGFYCGYSPERINPGDKKHTLKTIKKVVSGSNKHSTKIINLLYKSIIPAGTFIADSIQIAEAAKVIENTQRDLNIAFFNELSLIFKKLKIDSNAVFKAASTKWNFINFKPGLVGGHCIGVDPYYLTYRSIQKGYNPNVILSGRKINDNITLKIFNEICSIAKSKKLNKKKLRVLIMGLAFKEDCNDFRNTKALDFVNYFKKIKAVIDLYDPLIEANEFKSVTKLKLINKPKKDYYDIIIITVGHKMFKSKKFNTILSYEKEKRVIYDVKNIFKSNKVDGYL